MVSTQDFAHEVWLSLENIRERMAVVETELRYTRQDILRLESSLFSHTGGHGHPRTPVTAKPAAANGNGNGATVNIRVSRRALSSGGVIGGGLIAAKTQKCRQYN